MKGHRFRIEQIGEILYQLLEILEKLHHASPPVIHRDLKPSNIILKYTDNSPPPEVHLTDFGAVSNPQVKGSGSTVVGTYGYMSPEQLIGDCAIQSDYYALGASALHMLTGIVPSEFPSDGFKLLYEEKLKSIIPSISEDILYILKSLLAPQIADRPHDAEELIQMFQNAITKDAVIFKFKEETKHLENFLNIPVPVIFPVLSIAIFILPIQNIIEAFIGAILFIVLLIICVFTLFFGIHIFMKEKERT